MPSNDVPDMTKICQRHTPDNAPDMPVENPHIQGDQKNRQIHKFSNFRGGSTVLKDKQILTQFYYIVSKL